MRALVLLVCGCALAAPSMPAGHPASASAPTGRLAGAPATLRAGAVKYDDVPAVRAQEPHHHHHQP